MDLRNVRALRAYLAELEKVVLAGDEKAIRRVRKEGAEFWKKRGYNVGDVIGSRDKNRKVTKVTRGITQSDEQDIIASERERLQHMSGHLQRQAKMAGKLHQMSDTDLHDLAAEYEIPGHRQRPRDEVIAELQARMGTKHNPAHTDTHMALEMAGAGMEHHIPADVHENMRNMADSGHSTDEIADYLYRVADQEKNPHLESIADRLVEFDEEGFGEMQHEQPEPGTDDWYDWLDNQRGIRRNPDWWPGDQAVRVASVTHALNQDDMNKVRSHFASFGNSLTDEEVAELTAGMAPHEINGIANSMEPAPHNHKLLGQLYRAAQPRWGLEQEKSYQDIMEFKLGVLTPGGRIGDPTPRNLSPKENWVDKTGGMPTYMRMVRNALLRKGHTMSDATRLAVAAMRHFLDSKNKKVAAAAAKALAQWEAMRAAAHAGHAVKKVGKAAERSGKKDSEKKALDYELAEFKSRAGRFLARITHHDTPGGHRRVATEGHFFTLDGEPLHPGDELIPGKYIRKPRTHRAGTAGRHVASAVTPTAPRLPRLPEPTRARIAAAGDSHTQTVRAAGHHLYPFPTRDELREQTRQPIFHVETISNGNGGTGAVTYLVTFDDGSKAIYKQHEHADEAHREYLAGRVGEVVRAHTPPVIIDDGQGSHPHLFALDDALEQLQHEHIGLNDREQIASSLRAWLDASPATGHAFALIKGGSVPPNAHGQQPLVYEHVAQVLDRWVQGDVPNDELAQRLTRVYDAVSRTQQPGNGAGTWQAYVDGAQTVLEWGRTHDTQKLEQILTSDEAVRIGLVDSLTANRDRHMGNWLVDEHMNPVGIDHGETIQYPSFKFENPKTKRTEITPMFANFGMRANRGPFVAHFSSSNADDAQFVALPRYTSEGRVTPGFDIMPVDDFDRLRAQHGKLEPDYASPDWRINESRLEDATYIFPWIDNPLTAQDVKEIMPGLRALEGEYKAAGPHGERWFYEMMGRWVEIAKHAKGVRPHSPGWSYSA